MKRITTVYVDKDLLNHAKRLGINISRLLEDSLRREIARLTKTSFMEMSSRELREFEKEIYNILSIVLLPNLIPDKIIEDIAHRFGVSPETVRKKAEYLLTSRLEVEERIYMKVDYKNRIYYIADPERNKQLLYLISYALSVQSALEFSEKQLINFGKAIYGITDDELALERAWRLVKLVQSFPDFFCAELERINSILYKDKQPNETRDSEENKELEFI